MIYFLKLHFKQQLERYIGFPLYVLCFIFKIKSGQALRDYLDYLSMPKVSLFNTILVNFLNLKFTIAIKVPIYVYGKILLSAYSGRFIIEGDVESGMIEIGSINWRSVGITKIENQGKIIFKGKGIRIFQGAIIKVYKGGVLEIGGKSTLCENTMFFVSRRISIGYHTDIAYNSNLFDTNFHFTLDLSTSKIGSYSNQIEIGDYNWISNNTTIKPGVKTPNHLIVAASYSVLTKDYKEIFEPYSIVAGAPVRLIKSNSARVWNQIEERKIFDLFNSNLSRKSICLDNIKDMSNFLTE